jgi:ribosome recycling factor
LASETPIFSSAYLTLRDSGLLFLVVIRGKEFNSDVEQAITDLDLEIAQDNDYSLIRLGVHVLPECDRENILAFLSRQMVIELKVSSV